MTGIRILLVDDEPDIREVVDVSLGLDPEFKMRACASGADALVTAAEWSPTLILLDVMMPVMDGPTTLENLRKNPRTAHIPILFLTARAPGHGVLPSKLFLDLVEANCQQLLAVGVPAKSIDASPLCTHCNPELLFSYRAEKGKTGRMLAVVGFRG